MYYSGNSQDEFVLPGVISVKFTTVFGATVVDGEKVKSATGIGETVIMFEIVMFPTQPFASIHWSDTE